MIHQKGEEMDYKLEFTNGSLKTVLYFPDLKQAVECLRDVKRHGGSGRVFVRGTNGVFERVVAS